MPKVSITTSLRNSSTDLATISNYNLASKALDAKYQYMISEVLMIRLFGILESTIAEVALKLACGALYTNGNPPSIHLSCTSINNAYNNMLNHGRRNPKPYLKWTTANYISDSIKYILNVSDFFYLNIQNHGILINEMRIVRNHIAHKSTDTKQKYNQLLTTMYGGNPKLVVGAFLTSTARNSRSNIDRYITSTSIILNDITKGSI